jgi:4-hydroxybenzoate polyprenyltransferase
MEQGKYNKVFGLLALIRPMHWIKNGFVVVPLLFSQQFIDTNNCLKTLVAFLSFCAASSAIYALNDWCDRKEDSLHPRKKNRPVASGAISSRQAILLSVVLAWVSLPAGWYLGRTFLLLVLLYLVINIAYSLGIKHVAILDVMTIAGGFVLRILAGSVAISVPPSHWLILCTIMISMFLGFAKRRAELISTERAGENTRKVLQDYSVAFLDQAIAMVTAITIMCYALYTVDQRTVKEFDTHYMLLTVPSVMYGMFRYIYLIYHRHQGEDPTELVRRDIPTLINLIIWVILSAVVITWGREFDLFK